MKKKKPRTASQIRRDIIRRFACCRKAKIHPCVCAYSFKCKKHGVTHVGTHD